MNEYVQIDTSLAGSSLQPLTSGLASIEYNVDSSSSLGSHPMITRAKVGIFKTYHLVNLGILGSSGLLYVILASTEPRGFKFVVKNLAWVMAMDEEIRAWNKMTLGLWFLALPTPTS